MHYVFLAASTSSPPPPKFPVKRAKGAGDQQQQDVTPSDGARRGRSTYSKGYPGPCLRRSLWHAPSSIQDDGWARNLLFLLFWHTFAEANSLTVPLPKGQPSTGNRLWHFSCFTGWVIHKSLIFSKYSVRCFSWMKWFLAHPRIDASK